MMSKKRGTYYALSTRAVKKNNRMRTRHEIKAQMVYYVFINPILQLLHERGTTWYVGRNRAPYTSCQGPWKLETVVRSLHHHTVWNTHVPHSQTCMPLLLFFATHIQSHHCHLVSYFTFISNRDTYIYASNTLERGICMFNSKGNLLHKWSNKAKVTGISKVYFSHICSIRIETNITLLYIGWTICLNHCIIQYWDMSRQHIACIILIYKTRSATLK